MRYGAPPTMTLFLACPDFKGIKTTRLSNVFEKFFCFWPALISKGLRRQPFGLLRGDRPFLACPDFKGIKTQVLRWQQARLVSGLP